MSAATQERPSAARQSVAPAVRTGTDGPSATPAAPAGPRYRTMLAIEFHTSMSEGDLRRLSDVLDMATHLHTKLYESPVSVGVVRLDFDSGLFLVRGDRPGEWRLEGRTWGVPPSEVVHGWHVLAAGVARLLDRSVPVPPRLRPAESAGSPVSRRGRWSRKHSHARGRRS